MDGYTLLTSPVFLVVATLAAARLTRLVTTDSLLERPRLWASRYDWTRELVHCPWCIGFWITLAVVAILPPTWDVVPVRVLAVALAANHAFATLASATAKD